MSGHLKNKVHTDTPRPSTNQRVSIRWHPDEKPTWWGPKSHRPPRFPVENHLEDWSENSPMQDGPKASQNVIHGPRQPRANSGIPLHMQKIPETNVTSAGGQGGLGFNGELSRDNLMTHDENGNCLTRGSESDEESSSSKRSRDDMEDGLEDEAAVSHHMKRTRHREWSVTPDDLTSKTQQQAMDRDLVSPVGSGTHVRAFNDGTVQSTPEKGVRAGKVVLAPSFGVGNQRVGEVTEKPIESPKSSNIQRKEEAGDKKIPSLKATGIHRALQKQLLEKRIANEKKFAALPESESTEESEEEKENWNKVVESLTAEVEEMEPIPSLTRQLQKRTSPPLPPPVPFMHPWGLFPFGPMVSSFPYGPCHPFWLQQQQRPYFPPFPQMGQPVPSGVQFPPPNLKEAHHPSRSEGSPEENIQPPAWSRDYTRKAPKEGKEQVPGETQRLTMPKIPLLQHEDGEVPPVERQMPLLIDFEDIPSEHPSLQSEQVTPGHRQGQHIRFPSEEDELEEGEIVEEKNVSPTHSLTTSGEEEGLASHRPSRKVFVPGKIKQMTTGKCDLFYKTPHPPPDTKSYSFIQQMKQEPSVSIYARRESTESSGEEPVINVKQSMSREQPEGSSSDSESFQTPGGLRRDPRVIGPASAPAGLMTHRMPFSGPHSYSSCVRSPQLHSRMVTPTRAQLIARIQPRRRLTMQEEVMMEGIPKNLRRQFGLPSESLRSSQFHQLETGVVYPWSSVEYIDTHCHIDFLYQRLGCSGTFEKFARMRGYPENYGGCVAIFCTPESFHPSNPVWQNLLKEDRIWAAFGCHPHHVKHYDGVVETNILTGMMHEKAVAFGEIGLDYSNRNASDHVLQHMVFKRQLALAMQLKKPLVIHSREAESDTLDIMVSMVPKDYKIHRHCFTGPPEDARAFLDAFPNSFIGLTNLVTFPTAVETHRTAQILPLNKLLLETDAPYFLPRQCPKDIRWSHPAMAVFVAERIARLRGITTDEVLRAVRRNTREMYGV